MDESDKRALPGKTIERVEASDCHITLHFTDGSALNMEANRDGFGDTVADYVMYAAK